MINDALNPFWRGTKYESLPPITHYNNKAFAIRRKITVEVYK